MSATTVALPETSGLPTRMGGVRTRLGIMGGTFDPIHYGHLVTAEEALHQFELDEVVFVPTGRPWMKEHEVVSPAEDRYLMTVIATASNPLFGVSRIEVDRDGPTYTVDTLRELKHRARRRHRPVLRDRRRRGARDRRSGSTPRSCSRSRTSSRRRDPASTSRRSRRTRPRSIPASP